MGLMGSLIARIDFRRLQETLGILSLLVLTCSKSSHHHHHQMADTSSYQDAVGGMHRITTTPAKHLLIATDDKTAPYHWPVEHTAASDWVDLGLFLAT